MPVRSLQPGSRDRVQEQMQEGIGLYLSSPPPSFRTIFRREKTVPKMSLASSSALNAGREVGAVLLLDRASDSGRAGLPEAEGGRGSHRRL